MKTTYIALIMLFLNIAVEGQSLDSSRCYDSCTPMQKMSVRGSSLISHAQTGRLDLDDISIIPHWYIGFCERCSNVFYIDGVRIGSWPPIWLRQWAGIWPGVPAEEEGVIHDFKMEKVVPQSRYTYVPMRIPELVLLRPEDNVLNFFLH